MAVWQFADLTRYLYTGQAWDADVGLQYNWHRWYDPAVGRWISEDPIGFAAGDTDLSRYVANTPTNDIDPTGRIRGLWGQDNVWDWWFGNPPQWSPTPAPPPRPPILDHLPPDSDARHHLGIILVKLNQRLILPGGAEQCNRWVESARDIIVDLGKEYYDNPEYTITYLEWRFPPVGGWVEHAGLKITFKDGTVFYLDDGELSGGLVSLPEDVPANWSVNPVGSQSLDQPKGMPSYCSWGDLRELWRAYTGW